MDEVIEMSLVIGGLILAAALIIMPFVRMSVNSEISEFKSIHHFLSNGLIFAFPD